MNLYNNTVFVSIGGTAFEIAPADNDQYIEKFIAVSKGLTSDDTTYSEQQSVMCKAMAGTILVGWSDQEEFTEDAAELMLKNVIFRKKIEEASKNYDLFLVKKSKAVKKKS